MIGAFAYLILTSARNRVAAQLRRLKSPRYAAALVVGLLYFWSVLFRQAVRLPAQSNIFLGSAAESIAPLLLVIILGTVWLLGTDRSALAFSEAEVAMLFTAPVSRRGLMAYKLARSQIAIMINALIWVFLFRRGGATLPPILSAIGFWALFTTLSCHRLGAALVRAASWKHGVRGLRRNWLSIAVFGAIVVTVVAALVTGRHRFAGAADPSAFFAVFAGILSSLPVRIALYPFHLMLGPTFAHSVGAWALAMAPALGVLALNAWWVLQTDAAFEEAAAAASVERAKTIARMRERRSMGAIAKPKGGARTLPLAPTGRPVVAIVWKNMICLMRTSQLGLLVFTVVVAIAAAIGLGVTMHDVPAGIAIVAMFIGSMMLLLGGRSVRNDLRSDMLHLPFLKAMPLSGTQIVVAEIASGALVLAMMEFTLVAIAVTGLSMSSAAIPVPAVVRLGILVAAPIVLLAHNGSVFTILNGAAVLFPAWMRLGPTGGGGVEVMGTIVLATAGQLLAQVLMLVLPAGVAAAAFFVLRAHLGVAVSVACAAGGLTLIAECYALIRWLGRMFERAEPSQIT